MHRNHPQVEPPSNSPNSETLQAPGSRWRWMEYRWLVLVVTVFISAFGYSALSDYFLVEDDLPHIKLVSWISQLKAYRPSNLVIKFCALLWLLPLALRLGWVRTALWIVLVAAGVEFGSVVDSIFGGLFFVYHMPFLLPCLAIIGRRTRPWMAFLAVTARGIAPHLYPHTPGYFLSGVELIFPFAAILIFGTNYIPDRRAGPAPSD